MRYAETILTVVILMPLAFMAVFAAGFYLGLWPALSVVFPMLAL